MIKAKYGIALIFLLVFSACAGDDGPQVAELVAPTGLTVDALASDDGSGIVEFKAEASGAILYRFDFDDGSSEASENGILFKEFTKTGLNTYSVTVTAIGSGATSTSVGLEVSVRRDAIEEPVNPPTSGLIWSDEFDVDGAPNPANWGYDLGAGGWGNGEAQTYTDNIENAVVENGILKITAKSNGSGGFTSARLKSENRYEFAYGRVEIRAKVPSVGGTWPALWMLGANFDTVSWPACGELDIMEHVGNRANTILSTLHYPGNFAGNGPTGDIEIPTATSEFHVYNMEWTADTIEFWVDDNEVHTTFANNSSTPFNSDFFFIMNIAIGGTLGGSIDPGFVEDTMEVDYIRVYR